MFDPDTTAVVPISLLSVWVLGLLVGLAFRLSRPYR